MNVELSCVLDYNQITILYYLLSSAWKQLLHMFCPMVLLFMVGRQVWYQSFWQGSRSPYSFETYAICLFSHWYQSPGHLCLFIDDFDLWLIDFLSILNLTIILGDFSACVNNQPNSLSWGDSSLAFHLVQHTMALLITSSMSEILKSKYPSCSPLSTCFIQSVTLYLLLDFSAPWLLCFLPVISLLLSLFSAVQSWSSLESMVHYFNHSLAGILDSFLCTHLTKFKSWITDAACFLVFISWLLNAAGEKSP